ncbi:MAG TPA: hypothetical protein VGU61_08730 [Noviherbaspirillum sp.]|nr:hypothetical protein [Noviherbaspirillum sp.]
MYLKAPTSGPMPQHAVLHSQELASLTPRQTAAKPRHVIAERSRSDRYGRFGKR